MDHRFIKMEKDINDLAKGQITLQTDVAVITNEIKHFRDDLKGYMKRKDEVDVDQYDKLHQLEHDKANQSDIVRLANTIKWAVGITVSVILPAVIAIVTILKG